MIILYLEKMINNYKANGYWKIQLAMKINFISFLDINGFCTLHTKSDNIKILKALIYCIIISIKQVYIEVDRT